MNQVEAAWLAGIIDGEGSIYIRRSRKKETDNFTYALSVRVGMTHKRKKKIFLWTLDTRKAEKVLKEVYPYLVTKKEQATLALAFCSIPKYSRDM